MLVWGGGGVPDPCFNLNQYSLDIYIKIKETTEIKMFSVFLIY